MRARQLVVWIAIALGGCVPDLSGWRIVQEGEPPAPGQDGGAETPNPIDLGAPCPDPHILVGMLAGSSETARVLRIDPVTDTPCRASAILERQRAFGSTVADVDWHAETGAVLGLSEAVLGLDAEGFPAWRHDPFEYGSLRGDWVAAFGSGADVRVAVAWNRGSSTIDTLRLLDARGRETSADIELPVGTALIAAHPDGSGRLLMPARWGAEVNAYAVTDATTALGSADASPLWTGGVDLPASAGYRKHMASDVATGRLVVTHEDGLAFWQLGGAPPAGVVGCTSYCASFHAAAPDPSASDAAYAICAASDSSERHLVRVQGASCSLVIDGTALGTQTLQDVALVRAAL